MDCISYDHAFADDMKSKWPAWDTENRKKDEEKKADGVSEGASRPVRTTRGRRPPRYSFDDTPPGSLDGDSDTSDYY